MKTNNNRRKKEMALVIGATRLALSVILLGKTGAFAQMLTTLRDFGTNMDGQNPQAGVAFDQRGHLYGTAALGGADGNGIVYHWLRRGAQAGRGLGRCCTTLEDNRMAQCR